jgi:Tfp pilus assembly protein PilO
MNTRNVLIGLLVAILVVALWWFLFWRGTSTTVSDLELDLDLARQQQTELQTRVDSLRELERKKGEFDAAVTEISVSIPDDPSEAALLESIRTLARDSGLELTALTANVPVASADNEGLYEIGLNVNVAGEYFRVLQFLFDIEDLDRLVRVDQIAVAARFETETSTNILTVNFGARAFSTSPLPGTLADEEVTN